MPKPPAGYPGPSKGQPCGSTWQKSLVVTGEIPGYGGFGKGRSRTLAPIVPDLKEGKTFLGWSGTYEHDRRDQMFNRLETLVDQLRVASEVLSPKEVASIQWLIDHAADELDATKKIHMQWQNRADGSFPLYLGDTLADFRGAAGDWCTDPSNILDPPGPQYGVRVPAAGGGTVVCPTRFELRGRGKDRQTIAQRFIDAAHHIRCAEFGLWRLMLYRQALQDWYDSFWANAPSDLVVRPKKPWEPGGLTSKGKGKGPILTSGAHIDPPPPPTPPDGKLPPASSAIDPQPEPTGPDAFGGSGDPPRSRARRRSRSSSVVPVVATAAAVVGAGYLLTR